MSNLIPFLNRHAGETCWLFGKGPSLSVFDFSTAGPLRVAINDVIAHVPDCLYGFANDGVEKWRDVYRPGQILFQPRRALGFFDSTVPGAISCEVVTYLDDSDDRRLIHSREKLAEILTIRRGTLGSALQILHIMGVTTVHMVGIDGGGTHASGYQWRTRLRNDHARDYDAIRNSAIDSAWLMGITLKFHNQSDTMTNDGRIFVRFIRNSSAKGIPYPDGEIVSFDPATAKQLIAARAAEYFTPPAKPAPVIETTEAPMQFRESAVVATKKARKTR